MVCLYIAASINIFGCVAKLWLGVSGPFWYASGATVRIVFQIQFRLPLISSETE
jgi:hypothetical protein